MMGWYSPGPRAGVSGGGPGAGGSQSQDTWDSLGLLGVLGACPVGAELVGGGLELEVQSATAPPSVFVIFIRPNSAREFS